MGNSLMRILIAAAALLGLAATASAQQVSGQGKDCTTAIFRGFDPVTDQIINVNHNTCIAGNLSRQNDIHVPEVVGRAVRNSFGIGPTSVEPAGLSGLIAQDDDRLSASEISISPTADVAAVAPVASTMWNVWGDGRYLYSDYSIAAGDLDGPTWSGLGGFDYKLTDKITLGLLVSGDTSHLGSGPADSNSSSLGGGPYLGIVLTDNIVFSANVMGSSVESDQFGGLLQFQTSRIQAASTLTGYWYQDTWRFSPAVTLSWSKDWEKETSNFALPDRTIEVGLLTPSLQIGNTLRLSDTTTVEPWLGAALDWTFVNRIDASGVGSTNDPSTDLRFQAGLNFTFNTNTQLAITGEAAGLLLDDLNSYSVEANLAVQF